MRWWQYTNESSTGLKLNYVWHLRQFTIATSIPLVVWGLLEIAEYNYEEKLKKRHRLMIEAEETANQSTHPNIQNDGTTPQQIKISDSLNPGARDKADALRRIQELQSQLERLKYDVQYMRNSTIQPSKTIPTDSENSVISSIQTKLRSYFQQQDLIQQENPNPVNDLPQSKDSKNLNDSESLSDDLPLNPPKVETPSIPSTHANESAHFSMTLPSTSFVLLPESVPSSVEKSLLSSSLSPPSPSPDHSPPLDSSTPTLASSIPTPPLSQSLPPSLRTWSEWTYSLLSYSPIPPSSSSSSSPSPSIDSIPPLPTVSPSSSPSLSPPPE